MTVTGRIPGTDTSPATSPGRRIWTIIAMILSGLVLLLAIALIIGAWIGRSASIEVVNDVMIGVDQLTTAGRNSIEQVNTVITDVRSVTEPVQEAVERASQNVEDSGLLLTLLPEEQSQALEALADRTRTTLEAVMNVLETTAELVEAVDSLPFVNLPRPNEVGRLQQEVEGIVTGIEQLATDISQMREEATARFATVSATVAQINGRLETTQQNMALIDAELVTLQAQASAIRERFPTWATVFAILITLVFLWVSYAMVRVIQIYWSEWQTPRLAAATPLPVAPPAANNIDEEESEIS